MFIIDRIEGEIVSLEYEGRVYHLPKKVLPSECQEGDILHLEITIDQEQTGKRQDKIKKLEDDLFE